jgi:hypothetical protein
MEIINLSAGTYRVNWRFEDHDILAISGQGPATVLEPEDLAQPIIHAIKTGTLTLQNLAINGLAHAGATTDPTYFRAIDALTIHNVIFQNSYHRAVNIRAAEPNTNATIDHCTFSANHRNAIYAGNVTNLFVTNNRILDALNDTAVDIGERVKNIHVTNNTINNAGAGILVSNDDLAFKTLDNILIYGNIITSTQSAIQIRAAIDKTAHALISNNLIKDATWAARIFADNVTLQNNLIADTINQPVYIEGYQVAAINNTITGHGSNWAIQATGQAFQASGNYLHLEGGAGFNVTGDHAVIQANNFYDTNRILQLENAAHARVHANTAHRSTGGIFLIDTHHSIVDANVFFESINNNDIIEEGFSDFNRIRRNFVRNQYGISVIGPNTLAQDNDWW